jgi:protein SCO1/2
MIIKKITITLGLTVLLLFVFLGGTGMFPSLEDDTIQEGRIHIHKSIQMPEHTPALKKQALIFFGYVGCIDVCTPRLHEIAAIVNQYEQQTSRRDLDVLFINIDAASATQEADTFAKAFHPNFTGVTLPKNELMKLTSMFNTYFSAGLRDKNEINHTQHLYLLRKDANQNHYLRNIYIKVPYDRKIILDDLMKEEQ